MDNSTEQRVTPNTPPLDMQKNRSRKNSYWIVGIIIVVIVLFFLGYKVMKRHNQQQMSYNSTNQYTATENNTPIPSGMNTNQANSQTGDKSNTTTQQLEQDLQNIQGNLSQLNTDQTSSDQSIQNQLNDTQQQ